MRRILRQWQALILWTIVLLWMMMLFNLSSQVAEDSNRLSIGITEAIVKTLQKVAPEGNFDLNKLNYLLRKNAHFFAYLFLVICVISALKKSGVTGAKTYYLTLTICVLYAISDETHQLFVLGRGGHVRDVLLDSAGVLLGVGIYKIFLDKRFIKQKRK